MKKPLVGVIMGSQSDWETMQHAAQTLEKLEIGFETRVVSAHRTPDLLFEYASTAKNRGLEVIIAGAGGAAHLPGMCAAKTSLPVLAGAIQSPERPRFPAFHRPNARRNSRCDVGNWARGRHQRGLVRGGDSGQ